VPNEVTALVQSGLLTIREQENNCVYKITETGKEKLFQLSAEVGIDAAARDYEMTLPSTVRAQLRGPLLIGMESEVDDRVYHHDDLSTASNREVVADELGPKTDIKLRGQLHRHAPIVKRFFGSLVTLVLIPIFVLFLSSKLGL